MRRTCGLVSLVLVLGVFSGTVVAQRAPQRKGPPARGFFPPAVQQVVPGIDAVIAMNAEQKEKLAALRSKMVQSEEFQAAQKTLKDKSAAKADRGAALKNIREMESSLQQEMGKILTAQQQELISKINEVVRTETQGIRQEYREKIKAARGNKEEQQKLRKEIEEKTQSGLRTKILALLSEEQKAAVAKAAEELKTKRPGKKDAKEGKQGKKGEKGKKAKEGRRGKKKNQESEDV